MTQPGSIEGGGEARELGFRHIFIGHDPIARAREKGGEPVAGALDGVGSDNDVIGPRAQRHVDGVKGGVVGAHWAFGMSKWLEMAARMSLTTTSWGTSREATVMSASA